MRMTVSRQEVLSWRSIGPNHFLALPQFNDIGYQATKVELSQCSHVTKWFTCVVAAPIVQNGVGSGSVLSIVNIHAPRCSKIVASKVVNTKNNPFLEERPLSAPFRHNRRTNI